MANIVILGAGVMGSAIAVPSASIASNKVTLVGSPLDDDIVQSIQQTRHHPTLNACIPKSIDALRLSEIDVETLQAAHLIVIGVSSAGIDWVTGFLRDMNIRPPVLALVTKGLVENTDTTSAPLTYADALTSTMGLSPERIVGIGGPCIARELALEYPTRVTFACIDQKVASAMRQLFQTDYYRITTHCNIVALEACAALKNFLCIGVSAMLSAYPLEDSFAKNPVAALYNQAVHELFILSEWIANASPGKANCVNKKSHHVAFDLAGMGDLHVTVGGGRNSRLGGYLGTGETLSNVLSTHMKGVTVEGVDTGRTMLAAFRAACIQSELHIPYLPLSDAILNAIEHEVPFNFDFTSLPDG